MLPDRVSNPGPLTYESGALPIALRGPAGRFKSFCFAIPGDGCWLTANNTVPDQTASCMQFVYNQASV